MNQTFYERRYYGEKYLYSGEKDMKKLLAITLAVLMIVSFAACGNDEGGKTGEITFTDSDGKKITLSEPADVIVSISPAVTEMVFAVGAGDTLKAKSTWCNYPAEVADVEVIGDAYTGISIERIIELEADIVIITGSTAAGATEALAAANIPVCNIDFETVDAVYEGITNIGIITGKTAEAEALNTKLKADLKDLTDKCAAFEKRSLFIDWGGLYSSSKVDFFGGILEYINCENIAYDYEYTSPQVPAETVIEKNPDVYIVTSAQEYFEKPAGFDEIAAFKNGEVHYIDYFDPVCDMVSRPGPRFVEGLSVIAEMVHPELKTAE
ncbi:MAG: ABC transporter substrate-binding protein [Eubacteriaceae bacterium]|nr:ABC transporter substrate-binding protein [Eubacteriaceae bacterium]